MPDRKDLQCSDYNVKMGRSPTVKMQYLNRKISNCQVTISEKEDPQLSVAMSEREDFQYQVTTSEWEDL